MGKKKAGMLRLPLQDALDQYTEENVEQSPSNSIRASTLSGECERLIWYKFRNAFKRKVSGRFNRIFETGKAKEKQIIEELIEAGFEVIHFNPRSKNNQYGGSIFGGLSTGYTDAFIRGTVGNIELKEWHLLEVKSCTSAKYLYDPEDTEYNCPISNRDPIKHLTAKGNTPKIVGKFWQFKNKGVRNVSQVYFGTVQFYMGLSHEKYSDEKKYWQHWGLSNPLTRCLYVVVNKDTDQIHCELIEYLPAWFGALKRRAVKIARDETGPNRIKETPVWPPCSFCDAQEICHGNVALEKNCRTCAHSELKIPGDLGYFGTRTQWLCKKLKCAATELCDNYQPLKKPIEF